jgi:hypothetical protein
MLIRWSFEETGRAEPLWKNETPCYGLHSPTEQGEVNMQHQDIWQIVPEYPACLPSTLRKAM